MKPRIFASFSMGKSSAEMCRIIQRKYSATHDIKYGAANTTRELPQSLRFGKQVDEFLGLDCTLVEAVIHPGERRGSSHRITTWDQALLDGSTFEAMIQKYGIPNTSWLHCTRELKTNPMTSYLRSVGWEAGTYDTAIGYRSDEMDRVPEDYKERRQIYPLLDEGITKPDIYRIFATEWPFTLELEEHEGNCRTCFKKNERKLLTIMRDHPEYFDFDEDMQTLYGLYGAEFAKDPTAPPRRFYRKSKTVADLRALAAQDFEAFTDELYQQYFGDCQESCEPFMEPIK